MQRCGLCGALNILILGLCVTLLFLLLFLFRIRLDILATPASQEQNMVGIVEDWKQFVCARVSGFDCRNMILGANLAIR
jgi:hypothetical protein